MGDQAYVKTELYGGAITVNLPTDFMDVSEIRQVPDHQEVRLARNGLSSIVFDILERVAPPSHAITTDDAALQYHFADVVAAGHTRADTTGDAPAEVTRVWSSAHVALPALGAPPGAVVPALNICATQHPEGEQGAAVVPQEGAQPRPDFVGIMLTLVRLEAQKTDLVVAVNVPHVRGEYDAATVDFEAGRLGPLMERGLEWQRELLTSLCIEDWGLFVDEDDGQS